MSRPRVEIRYCTGCRWLLRAAWLAQELLSSLHAELGEVSLIPDATGGVFIINVDDVCVWDRTADGGFPDAATLKRRVRDVVDPERDLGHTDRS